MLYSVLIGGKAGQGVAKSSKILGKVLVSLGYYVFNYRDYPSLITGGHNFNVVTFSEREIESHEWKFDIIVALDENTVELHKKNLKENGIIVGDENLSGVGIRIPTEKIIEEIGGEKILKNAILLGSVAKIFGIDFNVLESVLKREFGENKLEIEAARRGYELTEKKINLAPAVKKEKYFLTGNEAIALGALAAGLDTYIAYPMTPATPVLHFLAKRKDKYNLNVLQLENEIAVVNAALGASYAGATVMVGTSGGGFALMSEALSLQGMSEVPLVVYLAQRTAPSTGVPTYTTQGDLKFALNAGHGEFPRVVIAPGDAKEAFYRTIEAFYLAYKYRVLSIILGDKHLGESTYTFEDLEEPKVKPQKFIVENPEKDYKSYKLTDNGVSPRAVPGQGVVVRATSYEHNEYGNTTEDPYWIKLMNEKRWKKFDAIKKEVEKLGPVKVYGKGDNLLIGWGSTKGAILDALKTLPDYRFMQIVYLSPFPAKQVKEEIEKSKNVILVENNVTGLLGDVIVEQTGIKIDKKILKYDARPFSAEEIVEAIKKCKHTG